MFTVYIVNNLIYFVKGFDVKNKHFYLPFVRVHICTVSDALHHLQHTTAVPIAPRGLSGIECRPVQRVQRPGVCVGAPCLAWSALASGTACPV